MIEPLHEIQCGDSMEISKEVLQLISEKHNIDLALVIDDLQNEMTIKEREKFVLEHHPYHIWQDKDGKWLTYLYDETRINHRKQIKRAKWRTLIDDLYTLYYKQEETQEMTLRLLYPGWKEYKRLHTDAETYIMRIDSDWKTYYSKDSIVDVPLKHLTKLMLDEWAHGLIQRNKMTKNCYYNVTVIMRQGLRYAVDLGLIERSPFEDVHVDGKRLFRKVKKKPDRTQVFTREEARDIIQMAWEDYHDKVKVYELSPLAVIFQLQTALRIGELCALRFEDWEEEDYIHVQRMLRRDTKEVVEHPKTECGDRQVLLTQLAKDVIREAKRRQEELGIHHEYIFSIVPGQPIIDRPITDLYEKYCRKLGTEMKRSHKARKTVISAWIDGNVNINSAREMAGHSSEKTTLKNYVYDRSTEREKKERIEMAVSF